MTTLSNKENPSSNSKASCLEMLQLILDGQATPQQHQDFKTHMERCMPCYKAYNLEMAIKDLLKTNCNGQAPPELIQSIKSKIESNHFS